jgi:membrane-bound lytic murein transglycosylase D
VPKGFDIRLPSSLLNAPIADLLSGMPTALWQAAQLPDLFHTIARGDTLSQIAEAYKTRVSTLVSLNSLGSSHRIRAGQRLRLPAAGPAPARVSANAGVSSGTPVGDQEHTEERAPGMILGDLAASLLGTIQSSLLSDPSDYSIAVDMSIEVHALETLGHYADWLEIRTQRLRDINRLAFRTSVQLGQRIRLDLSAVDVKTFEDRRIAYHRAKQDEFFRQHIITGVTEHVISAGESIWLLSLYDYNVPVWLFRQYNPELDLHNVQPGKTVRFPELTTGDTS